MNRIGDQVISVLRTQLPDARSLAPYLKEIDGSGVYSNFGPLHARLVERLAVHFSCEPCQIGLVSNATVAIAGIIQCTAAPGSEVGVPAWTFAATGHAVLQSCRPLSVLDLESSLPSGERLHRCSTVDHVQGIAVAPFGYLSEDLISSASRGKYLVVDSASCFDAMRGLGHKLDLESSSPFVVSAHATKGFSFGEGGIIIGPSALVEEVRKWSNFGFQGSRESQSVATNAKISEYAAAIGLASFELWREQRTSLFQTHNWYNDHLSELIQRPLALHHDMATLTYVVGVDPKLKRVHERSLQEENIDYRDWWSSGLHKMEAFSSFLSSDAYTNTDTVAASCLGLPFGIGFSRDEIRRVTNTLNSSLDCSDSDA